MREPRSAGWPAAASPNLTRLGVRSWLLLGVLGLTMAVLWLLAQVSGFVVPLVLAAVLGALFAPLVARLQAAGVPRSGGALLVLLGLTAIVLGSVWLVVSGIAGQSGQIRAQLTAGLDTLSSGLASRGIDIGSGAAATDQVGSATGQVLGGALGALSSAFSSVVSLGIGTAIAAFLVYYVLVDWHGLTRWVGAHVGLDADLGAEVVDDSAVAVRRYFWALTLSAVVTAVLIGGAAWLLGVPLAFTIAVVTLVTSYVPYLGAIVSGAFATLIALGANGVDTAIVILVVILVVQNIVQTVVLVRLAGTALSLHPIVVLGATIIGAAVAGMLGAALSSPAVAVAIMARRRLSGGPVPVDLPPAVADPVPDAQA
ncbi:MAG: AI-2E family transporter [Ornithinibacter sp.]